MIAVDASTPAFKTAAAVTTLVSNSFSPPAGSRLLVVVGGTNGTTAPSSITDSLGSHLTYTLLKAEGANSCYAGIFMADCASAQTGMTVTANFGSAQDVELGVIVLTGAAATATVHASGATAAATSASGTPSLSVTTTADSSWVLGMITNKTNVTAPTIYPGETNSFNGNTYKGSGTTSGSWAQATSSPAGASGNVVLIADSAPTAIAYSMVVVEILVATTPTRLGGNPVAVSTPTSPPAAQANVVGLVVPGRGGGLMVGQAVQYGAVR